MTLSTAARRRPRRRPRSWYVGVLALVLAACGSGEPSLTEYVDEINAASGAAIVRSEELTAQGNLADDTLTPQELQTQLLRVLEEVRVPLQQAIDNIDPPARVAALHALLWDWHADFIRTERALVERIGTIPNTLSGWTAFSDSPEVAAYRASLAEGKQVCIDFQSELDATQASGAFEEVPWIPRELSESVYAALGCEFFPDDPSTVYQIPSP